MIHIGLKIKQLVDSKKITVIELSKVLGKSRQTVYNLYDDENVSTEILKKINSELGIPISYFFDGSEYAGPEGTPITSSSTEAVSPNPEQTDKDDSFWKEQIRVLHKLLEREQERTQRCEAELLRLKNGGGLVYGP